MADSRFFKRTGPFSISELAVIGAARLLDSRADVLISDVAALEAALPDQVAVLHNPQHYLPALAQTKAGVVIVEERYVQQVPETVVPLISEAPYRSFARIAQAFYKEPFYKEFAHEHESCLSQSERKGNIDSTAQVAASAHIASTAGIGPGCWIGPYVVIEDHVEVGAGTVIQSHAVLHRGVRVGSRCHMGAGVTLMCCLVGEKVTLDAGVKIGQPGFGFYMDHVNGHETVPQLGRVIIGDHVFIGANTTVDRGSLTDTIIGSGTRIDNLVQIGHNVVIGKNCVIVAQVGIAGSTTIEDYVTIAGQAGLAGHLSIGMGAVIAGQSGVMRNVGARETVAGSPALPVQQWRRQCIVMQRMVQGGRT